MLLEYRNQERVCENRERIIQNIWIQFDGLDEELSNALIGSIEEMRVMQGSCIQKEPIENTANLRVRYVEIFTSKMIADLDKVPTVFITKKLRYFFPIKGLSIIDISSISSDEEFIEKFQIAVTTLKPLIGEIAALAPAILKKANSLPSMV